MKKMRLYMYYLNLIIIYNMHISHQFYRIYTNFIDYNSVD